MVGVGSWKLEVGSKFEVCSPVRLFYFLFQDFLFVFCRHFQNHNGSMVVGCFFSIPIPYRMLDISSVCL